MRRLISRGPDNERGAIGVIVALAMVALLGCVAITVDVGAMYAERAQLQSGADSAALAIAQQCSTNPVSCAATTSTRAATARATAQAYANANSNDLESNVDTPDFPTAASVHVSVTSRDAATDAGALALMFAPVLGIDSTTVAAEATARWGNPAAGPAMLPLAFAPCVFNLSGSIQILSRHGDSGGTVCDSTSPSGQLLPGGFGWLDDPTGRCFTRVDVVVNSRMSSDTGASLPSNCASVLSRYKDRTLLVPVYEEKGGSGSGGWYKIRGWAAFTLLGWNFPGNSYNNQAYADAKCKGSCKGLIGRFVRFVSLDERFTMSATAPNLGSSLVTLTH